MHAHYSGTLPSVIAASRLALPIRRAGQRVAMMVALVVAASLGCSTDRATGPGAVTASYVNPGAALTPAFTVTPTTPVARQATTMDASSSTGPIGMVRFRWSWGDGTADAVTTSPWGHVHAFAEDGTYPVTLSVIDANGDSAAVTQTLTVTPDSLPEVVVNPAQPLIGDLVSYSVTGLADQPMNNAVVTWAFSDGTTKVGASVTHTFGTAGSKAVSVAVQHRGGPRRIRWLQTTVMEPYVQWWASGPRPANYTCPRSGAAMYLPDSLGWLRRQAASNQCLDSYWYAGRRTVLIEFNYHHQIVPDNAVTAAAAGRTLAPNSVLAPDSTMTGDLVSDGVGTDAAALTEWFTVPANRYSVAGASDPNTVIVVSAFVQASPGTWLVLETVGRDGLTGQSWFNTTTWAPGARAGTHRQHASEAAAGGWRQIWVSLPAGTPVSNGAIRIGLTDGDGVLPSASTGAGRSLAVWGTSLEVADRTDAGERPKRSTGIAPAGSYALRGDGGAPRFSITTGWTTPATVYARWRHFSEPSNQNAFQMQVLDIARTSPYASMFGVYGAGWDATQVAFYTRRMVGGTSYYHAVEIPKPSVGDELEYLAHVRVNGLVVSLYRNGVHQRTKTFTGVQDLPGSATTFIAGQSSNGGTRGPTGYEASAMLPGERPIEELRQRTGHP